MTDEVYQGIDYSSSPYADVMIPHIVKSHTVEGERGMILLSYAHLIGTTFKGSLDAMFNQCNNLKHASRAFPYDLTISTSFLEAGFEIHQEIEPVRFIKTALSGVTFIIGDNFYTVIAPYEAPKLTFEHSTRVNYMLEDELEQSEPIYHSRSDIVNKALEIFFEHSI